MRDVDGRRIAIFESTVIWLCLEWDLQSRKSVGRVGVVVDPFVLGGELKTIPLLKEEILGLSLIIYAKKLQDAVRVRFA